MSRIFTPLAENGIPVDVIVESGTREGPADVALTVEHCRLKETRTISKAIAFSLGGKMESEDLPAKVSVIGVGMFSRPGYAGRTFASLGDAGIPIRMVSTSESTITCVTLKVCAEDAVRLLHQTFNLDRRQQVVAGKSSSAPCRPLSAMKISS